MYMRQRYQVFQKHFLGELEEKKDVDDNTEGWMKNHTLHDMTDLVIEAAATGKEVEEMVKLVSDVADIVTDIGQFEVTQDDVNAMEYYAENIIATE